MSIQTMDPNTNKTVKSFKEMTNLNLEAAMAQSQVAYHSWEDTSYEHRSDLPHKVATLMRVKKASPSALIIL